MSRTSSFFASTIGRKFIMAGTGIVLFGFVIAHMIGNLQLYLGAAAFNAYSEFLHDLLHGSGLWIARAVLLASVGLHIWAAASLTMADRAARPVAYRQWKSSQSTYASRSMRWSGVFLFAFIVFHILDLTLGAVNPSFQAGDAHHNLIASFRVVPVALFYLAAMLILGMHLRHGAYSFLQTLGLNHPRHTPLLEAVSLGFAALVVLGNLSFPLAVLFGVVK